MLEKIEVENVQHNHSLASKVNLRRFILFTRDPVRKGGELSIKAS